MDIHKQNITIINDSVDNENDFKLYGFYKSGSKYWVIETHRTRKGSENTYLELSNFVGKSLFHLVNGTNNSKRIILIQKYTGESYLVEVQSSDLKIESFETILKSKQCTFLGNTCQLKRIIANWMDSEVQAEIINTLGWNQVNGIYAFANGVFNCINKKWIEVDEVGIVSDDDKKYFLAPFSQAHINDDDFENQRKFKIIIGKVDFKEWTKLYYQAYGTNGAIAIQFLILSLFWDIVFDQIGFFPFLFLFGAFGTGKTSLIESLLRVLGLDFIGTPINNASQVGLSRTIASRNNTIFYLKEYTQDSDESIQDLFLTAYDGSGRTTGLKSNDNRTQIATVKSALLIDGNNMPTQKSAILSRMILLYCENNSFTNEQREAYTKLKQLEEKGLGQVAIEILSHRELFAQKFKEVFDMNVKELRESGKANFAERTIKHVALILSPAKLLFQKLQLPFSFDELTIEVVNNAIEQTKLLKQTDEVTIFWESFSYNIKKGFLSRFFKNQTGDNIKSSHYNIKLEANSNPILQIKLNAIYPEYVKYCKNNNQRFVDFNSLKKLITSGSYKPFIPNTQKGRGDATTVKYFGSCYQFFLDKINSDDSECLFLIDGVEINM